VGLTGLLIFGGLGVIDLLVCSGGDNIKNGGTYYAFCSSFF